MLSAPIATVVIATRNGASTIQGQLDALLPQVAASGAEVVISDNGSTDSTLALVTGYQQDFPQLHIHDASSVPGQCYARNQGALLATSDSLLFLDQDDVVGPHYLENMASALTAHDFIGARVDVHRLNPPWTIHSRKTIQTDGFECGLGFQPFVLGATIGVRRRVFEAVDGFDDSVPSGGEDVDFSWRMLRAGYEPFFVRDAILYYRYRTSHAALFRQALNTGYASAYIYKRFRSEGMPRNSVAGAAWAWVRSVVELASLRSRSDYAQWLSATGGRLGRLQGSFQFKVLYP